MKWRKLGRVWAPRGDKAWARTHAFVPTPHLIGDILRVYFTGLDATRVGRVGYVDLDPDEPTVVIAECDGPVLDIGEAGCFDDNGVNASSLLAWRGRLWLYYIGWQAAVRVPYMLFSGVAVSADQGHSFIRLQRVPVLDRTDAEPFSRSAPFVVEDGDLLRMWYWSSSHWSMGDDGRLHYNNSISYAESRDGIAWTPVRLAVIQPGEGDYAVGRPWVIRDARLLRMWFATRSFDNRKPYRIEYAESLDGQTWTRRDPGITTSPSGWDSEMVCCPAVIDVRGRRLMFYNGNRHGETGFGVAVQESD